ncbi:MAG: hypothetical protein S4CHLAM81_05680 [Chlamydiales bacterium]|nr:hypothetical protein [Chlamydiales bacterium]MCH9635353.1 hypothetical protein [Chlamydiales bacterium]
MRHLSVFAILLSTIPNLFGNLELPKMYWICEDRECGELNERDQSEGCKKCEEREQQVAELKNEYYREVLDIKDPDGAPHSWEEAEEFERSIQQG